MTSSLAYFYLYKKFYKQRKVNFFYEDDKNLNIIESNDINIFTINYFSKSPRDYLNNTDMLINTESFMHMSEEEILFYVNIIKSKNIKYILTINRLKSKRAGEAEFDKIFQKNNIKLIEHFDLSNLLEDQNLLFYENLQQN